MKKITTFLIIFVLLFSGISSFAATPVQVTLNKTKVGTNETITATVITSLKDKRVKIVENDGRVVTDQTYGYRDRNGKREWKIDFSFSEKGTKNLMFFSGNYDLYAEYVEKTVEITDTSSLNTDAAIRKAATDIIVKQEGTYNSVNVNDNGALSVGMMQWHGPNAHDLMKSIRDRDTTLARQLLAGTTIYDELSQQNYTWNTRILKASEKDPVSKFISSNVGKEQQDIFAENYMNTYITRAKNRGITSGGALVFYCDLAIQGGPGNADGVANLVSGTVTLDKIYQASLNHYVMGQYPSRRTAVYNAIRAYGYS